VSIQFLLLIGYISVPEFVNINVNSYGEHCECPGSVCDMPSPRQLLSSENLAMAAVSSRPRPLTQATVQNCGLQNIEHLLSEVPYYIVVLMK